MQYDGQLSYAIWLALPVEIREKLVKLFSIPRSGSTVVDYRVNGAVVTSDGYTAMDLQTISTSRMQVLLDSDSDNFYKLFEEIINHIDALLGGTFAISPSTPSASSAWIPTETNPSSEFTQTESKPSFCDQCASKGGRHLKDCPKR